MIWTDPNGYKSLKNVPETIKLIQQDKISKGIQTPLKSKSRGFRNDFKRSRQTIFDNSGK